MYRQSISPIILIAISACIIHQLGMYQHRITSRISVKTFWIPSGQTIMCVTGMKRHPSDLSPITIPISTKNNTGSLPSPARYKKLTFGALIKDYIDGRTGIYRLNPTIEWCKSLFESSYPDLLSSTYISNYKYFSDGNTMTATYDVRLPAGSGYTPSAYTTKTFVTTHHLYEFGFFTDAENFIKYQNLKEKMISSIKITDS